MEILYFYAKDELYGEFSNFAAYGIELDSKWWPTVEHYFQAMKFQDLAYQEKIRTASSPKKARELGQTRHIPIRADWEMVREEVMLLAVRKKFQTHLSLQKLLLATIGPLAEASPSDYYWGIGTDGSGQNKLGQILMQIREELRG